MSYQNNEDRPKEIGALWVKTSKNGNQYMSGVVEIDGVKHQIVCFSNKKQKPNQPDYRILPSEPRDNTKAPVATSEVVGEVRVEDIPFS